jgi:hypothetical protein
MRNGRESQIIARARVISQSQSESKNFFFFREILTKAVDNFGKKKKRSHT